MADLRFVKTKDIKKVAISANQLIFTDDGSMYFDYSSTLRLHNSGGATLVDYIPGNQYYTNDMVVYNGTMYRAISDNRDSDFVVSNWQVIANIGEGPQTIKATQVEYDNTKSGLPAKTLQAAIDELLEMIKSITVVAELDII